MSIKLKYLILASYVLLLCACDEASRQAFIRGVERGYNAQMRQQQYYYQGQQQFIPGFQSTYQCSEQDIRAGSCGVIGSPQGTQQNYDGGYDAGKAFRDSYEESQRIGCLSYGGNCY